MYGLKKMTPFTLASRSAQIYEQGLAVTPGAINSFSRAIDPPLVIVKAQGAYLFDADGQRYVDYHAAFGPIILGHCHPKVNRAVVDAISELDVIGIGTTEPELRLAGKIVEHVPSAEMVQFCNSGTEATYNAIRLSRAYTGRKKLLKFQGCYHGFHDYVSLNVISRADRMGAGARDLISAGILPEAVEHTLVAEFNNLAEVERIVEEHGRDLAAIILEPIPHNIGCVMPRQDFLEGLRRITRDRGIVLIFDEVITGFRHGLGGYQAVCSVTPDLTTLGKAIANGFPLAAVCGKRELMERFNTRAGGDVLFAGTFNAHPVGVAAGLATIEALEDGSVYRHMFALGERARRSLSEVLAELNVKAHVAGFGSVFVIYFMEPPAASYTDLLRNNNALDTAFRRMLVEKGFLVHPTPLKRNHASGAHTEEDIDRTVAAVRECLVALS
jgi:glutamate-1-semialdehyde 2,1-aminomutase